MCVCVCVYVFVCGFACVFGCLFVCLSACLFDCLSERDVYKSKLDGWYLGDQIFVGAVWQDAKTLE